MSNPGPPKVTVLMPVYNGEQCLREAIDSILSQTFTDFDFLIIDDGSTDRSVEVIKTYNDHRIRLICNEENIGLVHTLNHGIDLSPGTFIARMDCDDISLPKRLQKQVQFMESHSHIGVCGTWVETIGDDSGHIFKYPTDPQKIQSQLLFDSPLAHPSVIMRRSLLDKFHLRYNPQYLHAEDWFFWQRCSFFFSLSNIPEVLLQYRITSQSISRANEKIQLKTLQNIDSINFDKLGLDILPAEAKIHRRLGFSTFSNDTNFVRLVESWLTKLSKANEIKRLYPEPAFSQVLAERWFTVCTNATGQGLWVWFVFMKSPMSKCINLSLIKKLKFIVKCAIKWSNPKNA